MMQEPGGRLADAWGSCFVDWRLLLRDQNTLSAVLRSQPPKRVPLGCSIGEVIVLPVSCKIPTPQGLVTKMFACEPAAKRAGQPSRFCDDSKSQLPSRVPLGCSMSAFMVEPVSFKI